MNRDEFATLLKACTHLKAKKNVYNVTDDAIVDVLLKAGTSGPAPLSRVQKLVLNDDYLHVETEEHGYLLPISAVFGLKWKEKGETRASRTGFHA